MQEETKVNRILRLYTKLMNGRLIYKSEEALHYHVTQRTIQRDIEDIRKSLDGAVMDTGIINTILYDRDAKGYRLEQTDQLRFTNSEILAICKILSDSRAFTKIEMSEMIAKLIDCYVPEANQRQGKYTGLTGSSPMKCWKNISISHIMNGLRRVSSGNGFSLCTAESCSG